MRLSQRPLISAIGGLWATTGLWIANKQGHWVYLGFLVVKGSFTPNAPPVAATSKRTRVATAKVTDPNNIGDIEVTAHQRARIEAEATNSATNADGTSPGENVEHAKATTKRKTATNSQQPSKKKRSNVMTKSSTEDADTESNQPEAMVIEVSKSEVEEQPKLSPTCDVNHFFEKISVHGDKKPKRKCTGKYRNWAKANGFVSMLPIDTQARRKEMEESQSTLDRHVQPLLPKETVVPYSDELFLEAAIEWLVETNQPVDAIHHPKFQNMIDIAARATNGVKIPGWKATRRAIINLFKKNLTALRKQLLFIREFLYELARKEKDLTKRRKIDRLALTDDEWIQVNTLIDLLAHADKAQQAFSSEHDPTLHNALLALEKLHNAWEKHTSRPKYAAFTNALEAGIEKLEGYYNKTSDSDAYVFSMVLDPRQKMHYFQMNWSEDERKKVTTFTEKIFKERYEQINQTSLTGTQKAKLTKTNSTLLREVSDDEGDEVDMPTQEPVRTTGGVEPWRSEFNLYLSTIDSVPEGVSIVKWWGMRTAMYPTWSSLARDYLAIMGSSVSSERAFSGGGLVITKRRNRLKSDIVEALQFLKCLIKHDLIYWEHATSKTEYAFKVQDVKEELEIIEEREELLKNNTYIEIWHPESDSDNDNEWEDVIV
ncbi:hypothetical protein D9758_011302 [Tetrapyrgos nigripes]|uniref:HAT C-terminal dimerisation domain-containing protein n=1 Tax=Tetrapyrgos nigripes TaxID=182062 RepID=A0A8H5CSX0_9AGAR|nr:hypothetical protein D9758_011302 [Tetrapyrgos nigripes]